MNGYMIVESDKSYRKLGLDELDLGYPKEDGIRTISTHIIDNYPFMNFLAGFSKDCNISILENQFILEYGEKEGNIYTNRELIDKYTGFPIRKTQYNPRTKKTIATDYTIKIDTVTASDVAKPNLLEYIEHKENEEP